MFSNTDEWWDAIPEGYPAIEETSPSITCLAENEETSYYVAYVSEQNLLADDTGEPVRHPQIPEFFETYDPEKHTYLPRDSATH